MQYKHYERTPHEHNSIYTRRHVVKINSFPLLIIHIALSLYLLNEMQTMGMIFMGMRSHRCKHTHGTLHKYTRGWVDVTAISLIKSCVYPLFDCMGRGKEHTRRKTVMKHHWRDYYTHTVQNTNSPCRYLFSSIRIRYASKCIIEV